MKTEILVFLMVMVGLGVVAFGDAVYTKYRNKKRLHKQDTWEPLNRRR